jgi:DNA-directed RNA polymerase specialized sigma24 family protein
MRMPGPNLLNSIRTPFSAEQLLQDATLQAYRHID